MDGILRNLLGKTNTLSLGEVVGYEEGDQGGEVELTLLPTGETVFAEVLSNARGSEGGVARQPKKGEVALIAMIGGDLTSSFVVGWLAYGDTKPAPCPKDTTVLAAAAKETLEMRAGECFVKIAEDGAVKMKGKGGEGEVTADGKVDLKGKGGAIEMTAEGEVKVTNNAGCSLVLTKTGGVKLTGVAGAEIFESLSVVVEKLVTFIPLLGAWAPLAMPPTPAAGAVASNASAITAELATLLAKLKATGV